MARYLKSPARWHRDLVNKRRAFEADDNLLEAALAERKLLLERQYLIDSIKLVRKYVPGFESRDGFDLNKVALIPDARLAKVRKYAPILRKEIAEPHIDVTPRSNLARDAIRKHTGQMEIPERKKFVVFTERPDGTTVRFKTVAKTEKDKLGRKRRVKQAQVEVVTKVKDIELINRYFYLPEQLYTFEDIVDATRKLLRFMPRGFYVLVSREHGFIGAPITKERLLIELNEYYSGYDKFTQDGKDNTGLAGTIIGYKYISYNWEGAKQEYKERTTRRVLAEEHRRQVRARERARVLRRLGNKI